MSDSPYRAAWRYSEPGGEATQESLDRTHLNTPPQGPWWTTSGGWVSDPSMCPALEIRIDQCTSPATICLTGLLDGTTEGTFLRVMDELLAEGVRHLMIDAGAVEVGDASGASALTKLQRRTREVGGSLRWEGVDFNEPSCRVSEATIPSMSSSSQLRCRF